mmetsp:Transcript_89346/g.255116  ORF Transcript_89346/g.255116 Transcript_89346/m.255116 type:complete len:231 (-) Transcript_89346:1046-1738(-)
MAQAQGPSETLFYISVFCVFVHVSMMSMNMTIMPEIILQLVGGSSEALAKLGGNISLTTSMASVVVVPWLCAVAETTTGRRTIVLLALALDLLVELLFTFPAVRGSITALYMITPIRAVSSVVMPMCFGACSAFVDSSKGISPKHTKAYDADPDEALKVHPPRSCFDQIVRGRRASISTSLRLERSDTLLDYDTSFHLAPPRFTMHRLLTLRSNPYTSFHSLSDTVSHAV